MDWAIAIGLLIQATALVVLFGRLGRSWLTHAGAVFIVLAVAYHGLNEVLLWMFPNQDSYRFILQPSDIDAFIIWISFAILFLTVVYVFALGSAIAPKTAPTDVIRRVFDWRLMGLFAAPLLALTIAGNGFNVSAGLTADTTPIGTAAGLASQFLLLSLVLASFGFVVRFGQGWLLPVLVVQSTAVALIGQRLEILICAILLLYALALIGMKLRRRQLVFGFTAFAVVGLVVTSARAAQGHQFVSTASSGDLRLDYLAAGVTNLGSPSFWNELSFDAGHRLDGNSFGAFELVSLDLGYPPLGAAPLVNDFLSTVPSFINPVKVYAPLAMRSDKEYAEVYLRIPLPYVAPGLHEDILPTQLGGTMGLWGPWGMLLIAVVLGIGFGRADRWLLKQRTPSRLVIGLGLMLCVLYYERSWNEYPFTFRGIAVMLVIVWILQHLTANKPQRVDPIIARLADEVRLRKQPQT